MQAVLLAAPKILLGEAEIVVAGGMEHMSSIPYLSMGTRWGVRMGHEQLLDAMYKDGYICGLSQKHMGELCDAHAEELGISREAQDEYALGSQRGAVRGKESGFFAKFMAPVEVRQKGQVIKFADDKHVRADTTLAGLAKLPPAFAEQEGTITAGNASAITDGATTMVVSSKAKAAEWALGYERGTHHIYWHQSMPEILDLAEPRTANPVISRQARPHQVLQVRELLLTHEQWRPVAGDTTDLAGGADRRDVPPWWDTLEPIPLTPSYADEHDLRYLLDEFDYPVVLAYWTDHKVVIARMPDLRGSAAAGDSPRSALIELELVAKHWMWAAKETSRPLPPRPVLQIAGLEVDLWRNSFRKMGMVKCGTESVVLWPELYRMLLYLVRHPDQVVPPEILFEEGYGSENLEPERRRILFDGLPEDIELLQLDLHRCLVPGELLIVAEPGGHSLQTAFGRGPRVHRS